MITDNASPDYIERAQSLPAEESSRLLQRFDFRFSGDYRLKSMATTEKVAYLLRKEEQDLVAWRENLAALRRRAEQ